MTTVHLLKQFDPEQLFRLFVDGRFHKKYDGWVGYESGERGSVQALLNGFAHMMDNLDLTGGLKSTYILDLHKICMMGVQTKNLKSSPGDLRFLNSGMPFFPKTTTFENLCEILEMRKGDGTAVFNNAAYAKIAEELDAKELYAAMHKIGKINYRNWYPNITQKQQSALAKERGLMEYYQAKYHVQMQFAERMEAIVDKFNKSMEQVENGADRLRAIALLVRELELLHPFPDGNCRTVACVLLTQLLLNYEFTPSLLDNPNLDGECSLSQWVEEIERGMSRFHELLKNKTARIFDYSIDDTSTENRKQFSTMSRGFLERINSHEELYLTPTRLLQYSNGKWYTPCSEFLRFSSIGTYKTYGSGCLYFALEIKQWALEKQDIRLNLQRIISKGVKALVLDDPQYADGWSIPVCLVQNCFEAFKAVAIRVRQDLNPKTILITGTEGKTGAKVQLHHLLGIQTRAHAVRNSANTEVPVLRSLASLRVDDLIEINEVSVGSDEAYRVERSVMVNPDMCLFTNIGPNHMDMHKTMEGLLRAKSSVVEGLRSNGICVVNADNIYCDKLIKEVLTRKPNATIIKYGSAASNEGRLIEYEFNKDRMGWKVKAIIDDENVEYFVPLVQLHAPLASVGVLLTIKRAGFNVQEAAKSYDSLQAYETMGQVVRLQKNGGAVLFYDQSRRGGISGMQSAFDDLKHMRPKGRVVALVGGISVLRDSEWTQDAHHQLAELINDSPIDVLYTTGNYIEYVHNHLKKSIEKSSNDLEELAALIADKVEPDDLLFVIGSAYLYLGRVADRIKELLSNSHGEKYSTIGNHPSADIYRMLKVYHAISKGEGAIKASASNGVLYDDYKRKLKQFVDFASYRGSLLFDFFEEIKKLLPVHHQVYSVDDLIADSIWTKYVVNKSFCKRWFNNLDKKSDISSKQVFGTFFHFGSPDYLIHLDAATQNLHIGLVHCPINDNKPNPRAMDEEEAGQLLVRYPALRELGVAYRKWGPVWLSLDLGPMIDLNDVEQFKTIVDCRNSDIFNNKILPFLIALK